MTEADLQQAFASREAANRRVIEARDSLNRLDARAPKLRHRLRIYRRIMSSRVWVDRALSRPGGQLILSTTCPAITVLLIGSLTRSSLWIALAIAVGLAGSAIVGIPLLFRPPDPTLAKRIELDEQELAATTANAAYFETEMERSARSFSEADAAYRRIYSILHGRLHRLLSCRWQGFTGTEFETFLADLFKERGYTVETTKVTGDQGLDLILIKNGRRIGVQAKGYPGSTVGNKAVQEVHAGMTFYACHASAVITNSTFTRGAKELASKVGCVLIDKTQIPGLLNGTISL